MDSFTITCTGKSSVLEAKFFPPIQIPGSYQIGLKNFFSYNAVFNIKEGNNVLYYYEEYRYKLPMGNLTAEKFINVLNVLGLNLKPAIKRGQAYDIISNNKNHVILNKGLIPWLKKYTFDKEIDVQYDIYYYDLGERKEIIIPPGVYEISDIEAEIKKKVPGVSLQGDTKSFKCELFSPVVFDFETEGFGKSLLGFRGFSQPNTKVRSVTRVNINNMNVIRVHCNIASGSYLNGKMTHSVYEFYPSVPPGYKIVEVPSNLIYYPIDVEAIETFTVSFRDQNEELIDFNDEEITVNFHIKKT